MMNYWITVVDDDSMSLSTAKNLLTSQNMKVTCLRSGSKLMDFIQKNTPDLILLDVMMPGTDGFETYRRLREFEENSGRNRIPVIFLSGDNASETEHRGLKIGAADYVRKPFDPDILMSRIHNAVSNSRIIENLIEEAEHDKLTGFLNKAFGTKKIAELCGTKKGVLLLMDIDSFKPVNDLYGHETGDRVLVLFADTVKNSVRNGDVVSRIGGDEFLAFFPDIEDENTAAGIIKRLSERFVADAKSLMGNEHDIPIGISVGAAFAPVHSADYETLFRFADQTMYKVKKNGKHGFAVYDPNHAEIPEAEDLRKEMSGIMQIVEERGIENGAMLLGQDSFSWNYRFIMRFIKRYKGAASRIVFSVISQKNAAETADAAEEFGTILQKTLRISDIIMQSKTNQFFLLLPELSEQDVESVVKRILRSWDMKNAREGITVNYYTETASYKDD